MDVSEPASAVAPGLTVAILRTLASRSTPVSAAQLRRIMQTGTEAGVRRAVERLAVHGVCLREQVADRTVYSLNHDHVLHGVVTELIRADGELRRRLKRAVAAWDPAPVSAMLFGSTARRDGDLESDVDLLLVRPVLRTESQRRAWAHQVHDLRCDVERWTGNRPQVLDRGRTQLRLLALRREPLIDDLVADAVVFYGAPITEFFGAA